MSKRSVGFLLEDMREAMGKIRIYTTGLDRDDFLSSGMVTDAVVRNLEIIGEAANRLPEEFTARHPEIEWRKIIGLRNRIVHHYFGVDLDIIWTIIRYDLLPLESQLLSLEELQAR